MRVVWCSCVHVYVIERPKQLFSVSADNEIRQNCCFGRYFRPKGRISAFWSLNISAETAISLFRPKHFGPAEIRSNKLKQNLHEEYDGAHEQQEEVVQVCFQYPYVCDRIKRPLGRRSKWWHCRVSDVIQVHLVGSGPLQSDGKLRPLIPY